MHRYRHIFFDLDKTLWDFTENTKDTFDELFKYFQMDSLGIPSSSIFLETYEIHNNKLWDLYRKGKVEKNFVSRERFVLTLKDFGIHDKEFAFRISEKYIEISPLKTKLIKGAIDSLEYLADNYVLHIITNGFREVQYKKLETSNLANYFKTVTTSEEAGFNKPDKRIFLFALKKANAAASECIMIGDDIGVDIIGAKDAGIDQVFVNLEDISSDISGTFEVKFLEELKRIL